MPNPFNQQVTYNNMSNLRSLYQALNNSSNPLQVFQKLAQNNPNLQPIVNLLNNGYNPEQVFYSLCKQRGVDPQQFLKNITG